MGIPILFIFYREAISLLNSGKFQVIVQITLLPYLSILCLYFVSPGQGTFLFFTDVMAAQ